jgi:hypothetical protein
VRWRRLAEVASACELKRKQWVFASSRRISPTARAIFSNRPRPFSSRRPPAGCRRCVVLCFCCRIRSGIPPRNVCPSTLAWREHMAARPAAYVGRRRITGRRLDSPSTSSESHTITHTHTNTRLLKASVLCVIGRAVGGGGGFDGRAGRPNHRVRRAEQLKTRTARLPLSPIGRVPALANRPTTPAPAALSRAGNQFTDAGWTCRRRRRCCCCASASSSGWTTRVQPN